jgi:heme-degrading monooxygenase HmoA
MHPSEQIQIVTFNLAGLEPEDYAAHCEQVAPRFAELPGLRAKIWVAQPETNTYGGVYVWESREAMAAYVDGPQFAALLANEGMVDVTDRHFDVLAAPTAITAAGRLAGAGA